MNIHQKLKQARMHAELTQEEVTTQLGISRQTLSNWENGRSSPDINNVLKLSDLYGISLDQLLRDDIPVKQEHIPFLKRYWSWFYEAAVVSMIFSILADYYQAYQLALGLRLLGLAIFVIPRLLFLRLFGGSILHILPGILGWCLLILEYQFYNTFQNTPFPIFLWLGAALVIFTLNKESPFKNLIKPVFFVVEIVAFCIILLVVLIDAVQNTGGLHVPSAFGHTFHARTVLYPENYDGDTPFIKLKKGSSNITLHLIDTQTRESEKIGVLQKSPTGWQVIPEDDPHELYQLVTEPEDNITLAYFRDDILQWKYHLTRIDTLRCIFSSEEDRIILDPKWYMESPEPAVLDHLSISGSMQLHVIIDDPEIEALTVYEEYYRNSEVEYTTYTLGQDLPIPCISPRYPTGEQYAIYHIPYQDGEYTFRINFE